MKIGLRYFKGKPKKEDVVALARKILPVDINICDDGKVLVVKHSGERKFEQAPNLQTVTRLI